MKKAKAKKAAPKQEPAPTYTHRDAHGMGWRMVGSRPVSALADQVMRECGLPPRTQ